MKPALVLLLLVALVGCSDAFDPFVESDQTFALYGLFDGRRDTQFVRLQPVIDEADTSGGVEARVVSTEIGTGEQVVWQDSLVVRADGSRGTLFFARFRPLAGQVYRLEASRADGATSTAEVRLPAEPPFSAETPTETGDFISQRVVIDSARPPSGFVVTYTVRPAGGEAVRVDVVYDVTLAPGEGGFRLLVSLSRDVNAILSSLSRPVELLALELTYDLANEPAVPVTGGIGAVGVAARFTAGWTLAPDVVADLGLIDAQGG